MSKRKQHKRGGVTFKWHPTDYDGVRQAVAVARSGVVPVGVGLAQAIGRAIELLAGVGGLGGLECPSPSHDPHGVYRVGLDSQGRPTIQRRDESGAWQAVS